jgi:putative ABC transport system ATP-binding protein
MKIKTADLTKSYDVGSSEVVAVNKVNLEINEPSFIAVIGPSGSGKSTLLNLIGLNDRPTSGKIYLDDVDVSEISENYRRRIRRERLGFIFQAFNLLPTLNALENVEVPLAFAGKTESEQQEEAVALLRMVGLEKRIAHQPRQLSMGEMQRVAIARALVAKPEMVIADEPTGELDSETGKEIVSLLARINREMKTALIVATHDEKVVKEADRIYRIHDGRLSIEP